MGVFNKISITKLGGAETEAKGGVALQKDGAFEPSWDAQRGSVMASWMSIE